MKICDFCLHFQADGKCALDLKLPNGMSCREFASSLEKFCADPKDFVNQQQVVGMATFFGIKGSELKKVKIMATLAEAGPVQVADHPEPEPAPKDFYSPYASFNLRK